MKNEKHVALALKVFMDGGAGENSIITRKYVPILAAALSQVETEMLYLMKSKMDSLDEAWIKKNKADVAAALASRVQGPSDEEIHNIANDAQNNGGDNLYNNAIDVMAAYKQHLRITAPTLTWDMVEKILPTEEQFLIWCPKIGNERMREVYVQLRDEMRKRLEDKQ